MGVESGVPAVYESPIMLIDLLHEITVILQLQSQGQSAVNDFDFDEECRMSGANTSQVLVNKVRSLELNLNVMVGQGYDGASDMSSQLIGAAAEVRLQAPHAQYFHCAMHVLNLCASQSARVLEIRNCLDVVRQLTAFISSSAKRSLLFETEIKATEQSEAQRTRLITLCTTSIVKRHEAVITVVNLLPFIVTSLDFLIHFTSVSER